jgi:cytochrome c553
VKTFKHGNVKQVIFFALLVFMTLGMSSAIVVNAQPQEETCAVCHAALGVEQLTKPVELYKADIHAAKGFGCVACHGRDGTKMGLEAMDRAKGYIGKPNPSQVIQVCGRCHSDAAFMRQYNPSLRVDQVAECYTSVHGRRLKELGVPPEDYRRSPPF